MQASLSKFVKLAPQNLVHEMMVEMEKWEKTLIDITLLFSPMDSSPKKSQTCKTAYSRTVCKPCGGSICRNENILKSYLKHFIENKFLYEFFKKCLKLFD